MLLNTLSSLLQPDLNGDAAARLTTIGLAGPTAAISAAAFVAAQLPFVIGLIGAAALGRARSPRFAVATAVLVALGAAGHLVWGGISLTEIMMAGSPQTYAPLLTAIEASPIMLVALSGMLGTISGLVLLGVTLLRSRAVAIWVPVLLWLAVLVEFVGSTVSRFAPYASLVLVAMVAGALVLRLLAPWPAGHEVADHAEEPIAA